MNDQTSIKKRSKGDQILPIRDQRSETRDQSRGRATDQVDSPSPYPARLEIFQILRGGVDGLSLNDYGRPWPYPNRATIARLVEESDFDLCVKAAREAREIVLAQDRAPNITALFEKRLRDLAGEAQRRDGVRSAVRESIAGEAEPCR